MHKSGCVLATLVLMSAAAFGTAQATKLPVPSQADQKRSEADVKALLKEDFAAAQKDRAGKQALAQRLLAQAADEKNSPTSRYVILRIARDLAIEALDLATAFDAIERMSQYFELGLAVLTGATFTLERNGWKASALSSARKYATSQDDILTLSDAYLALAYEVLSEKSYADALQSAQLAEQYAKTAKLASVTKKASLLLKEIPELKKEEEAFGEAVTSKADDPAAKLVKGRVLLFGINETKLGIEALVGCSDAGLAAVAVLEQRAPATTDDRLKVAETWFALAKKEASALHRRRYHERSAYWFKEALTNAGGLDKIKIEKRLEEVVRSGDYLPDSVDITKLKPKSTKAPGIVQMNSDVEGRKCLVSGKECNRFIFAHAPSALVYDVPFGMRVFTATGVAYQGPGVSGSWKYIVLADGKPVFESKPLSTAKNLELEMKVALPPGTKEIELMVDPLGSTSADWSVWAYPLFLR